MIRNLFGILALDSDIERRRKLLNLLISGIIICCILAFISTLILDNPTEGTSNLRLLTLFYLIISSFILLLNRFGPSWISGSLFLLSLILIIAFGDSPLEVISGRSAIFFAIPIVMSSVLLPAAASFMIAFLISGISIGIAIHFRLPLNFLQIIGFFIMALTSWISARSLEGAIKELRRINQELDNRVEKRTMELSTINHQLETEIGERIKTEQALQESETRFREMSDLLPTGICEVDLELHLIYVNKVGYDLFVHPGDLDTGNVNIIDFFHPEDREKAIKNIERVLKGERIGPQEYRVIDKSGKERYCQEESVGIFKEGRIIGIRSSVTDITEQKVNQNQLKEFAAQLEETNRELQQFSFIASHDLQEPLRKIMVFGDRLKSKYENELGEDGRDYLTRMQNAANRMQNLINDLLTYARITSRARPFEEVDLNKVLREVVSDLEIRIEQTRGRVILANLPVIEADPTQMQQLFLNLLANGLKFHRSQEPPVIRVSAFLKKEYNREKWEITVEDNGIGVDETNYERIFGVFQKLHGRNEYEGTGVGLAVCKKIAERHGGKIWVTSIPGTGSKFVTQLPAKQRNPKRTSNRQKV